jgi:hypothetical protein
MIHTNDENLANYALEAGIAVISDWTPPKIDED